MPDDERARNEEASVWMHRGIDLLDGGDPAALKEAVRCFDAAIALRRTLPLDREPHYRYGLSAGWVNRADAWARRGEAGALDEAVRSYGEALALLETLPFEANPLYPRRLAITRINLGVALQKRGGTGDLEGAAAAFRAALPLPDWFPGIADGAALQAAAASNLAGTLASLGRDAAEEARAAARRALELARPAEESDAASAEAALGARHALCRLLVRDLADRRTVPDALATEATDAVEEGIALAARWRERGRADFTARGREIVRFGLRIYGAVQPRFLAEFLVESLALDDAESPPLDAETYAAAQAALWNALESLQAEGIDLSGPLLDRVRELNAARERLERRAPR